MSEAQWLVLALKAILVEHRSGLNDWSGTPDHVADRLVVLKARLTLHLLDAQDSARGTDRGGAS